MFLSALVLGLTSPALAGGFLPGETSPVWRGVSFFGIGALVLLAMAISVDRKAIRWRPVLWGLGLQLLFGALVLAPALQALFFDGIDGGVRKLLSFSEAGATFVFQSVEAHQIVLADGASKTFIGQVSPPVKTFAFWILPTIVFFSSLMSILYHLGVMQVLVRGIAWLMVRTMGTSGAESLAAAANVFVGQTEAPLVVRPFIAKMTRSELHAVMTGGFATVAGGVMAAYVGFLKDIPGIAGHLVTASILSAPAALAFSKIILPETEEAQTAGQLTDTVAVETTNVMEAAALGATDGVKLALNVAGMLIAFVGLVAMVNWGFSLVPVSVCDGGLSLGSVVGCAPLSIEQLLGWLFAPIAVAMGVPFGEASLVGQLLGEKIVLTEFIAYIHLGGIISGDGPPQLSERSALIASYALCGFANFASIGIQLGGLGAIAPERLKDLSSIALRAMIAGSLAAFCTANVVGIFTP
jgi:CNT family concentrative nucleoside transporter